MNDIGTLAIVFVIVVLGIMGYSKKSKKLKTFFTLSLFTYIMYNLSFPYWSRSFWDMGSVDIESSWIGGFYGDVVGMEYSSISTTTILTFIAVEALLLFLYRKKIQDAFAKQQ